jgi:hypothetical protein
MNNSGPKSPSRRCGYLSASEFHRDRPIREAQGNPMGRIAGAICFDSFFFRQRK